MSTSAASLQRSASQHEMLADVVVLPTPPLPDVTTIISANAGISYEMFEAAGFGLERAPFSSRMTVIDNVRGPVSGTDARETQFLARQPGLHGAAGQLRGNPLDKARHTGDRDQFGMT